MAMAANNRRSTGNSSSTRVDSCCPHAYILGHLVALLTETCGIAVYRRPTLKLYSCVLKKSPRARPSLTCESDVHMSRGLEPTGLCSGLNERLIKPRCRCQGSTCMFMGPHLNACSLSMHYVAFCGEVYPWFSSFSTAIDFTQWRRCCTCL